MVEKSTTKAEKPTTAAEKPSEEGVLLRASEGVPQPAGSAAYVSDRNLAEVNAGEVVYLDEETDLGKRLLATGYFTEVPDPQA